MSLQANKTRIATFVVIAGMLGVYMVILFGGSKIFSRHEAFLFYFADSVNGLEPGSAVKFRGVPIGFVEEVRIRYQEDRTDLRIPVFVRVDVDRMRRQLGVAVDLADPAVLEAQVQHGLRGKLEVESYISGTMYIDLGYHPEAAAAPPLEADIPVPVIPTVESSADDILNKIQRTATNIAQYDFEGMARQINDFLNRGTNGVERLNFANINNRVISELTGVTKFAGSRFQIQLIHISTEIQTVQKDIENYNGKIVRASGNIVGIGKDTRGKVETFSEGLVKFRTSIEPGGSLRLTIDNALIKVSDMAISMREKTDAMELQPSLLAPKPNTTPPRSPPKSR